MSQKSYAHSRKDLPGQGNGFPAKNKAQPPFEKAKAEAKSQGSQMVQRSAPAPQPRPSLELASGADRKAFNDNWERERKRALFIAQRVQSAHQRRLKDRRRE